MPENDDTAEDATLISLFTTEQGGRISVYMPHRPTADAHAFLSVQPSTVGSNALTALTQGEILLLRAALSYCLGEVDEMEKYILAQVVGSHDAVRHTIRKHSVAPADGENVSVTSGVGPPQTYAFSFCTSTITGGRVVHKCPPGTCDKYPAT